MKYLVTGANGWIGSAVTRELLAQGHAVTGLARSDASAAAVTELGAEVVRGDLTDPAGLARAAAASDGVVHLAFQHDVAFGMGDFPTAARNDRNAIEAMCHAMAGTDKPFVLASGLLGLNPGNVGRETDGIMVSAVMNAAPPSVRQANALLALSMRGIGVRSSVLRYPPTVHGTGDKGFMKTFINVARDKGVSGYVESGDARWPAVHISDAASVTVRALTHAPAGAVIHAAGDNGVRFGDIAGAIGRKLGVPTRSIPMAEALAHFGHLGPLAAMDSPADDAITRRMLDWEPTGPSLLDDLAQDHYYA